MPTLTLLHIAQERTLAEASYSVIVKQVLSLRNLQTATGAYPVNDTDVGDTRFNAEELKEAIVQADLEARMAICETPGNGFRGAFIAPVELTAIAGNAQAAELPERIGPVSLVEVKVAAADVTWRPAEQAPLNEIREMVANPDNVFGVAHNVTGSPTAGYYFIDENSDVIHWTGSAVRVHVATLGTVDRDATPALLTPDAYSSFLVARALALWKSGDTPDYVAHYSAQAERLMARIRLAQPVLPQVEPILRNVA
jgi:hypothetical protein